MNKEDISKFAIWISESGWTWQTYTKDWYKPLGYNGDHKDWNGRTRLTTDEIIELFHQENFKEKLKPKKIDIKS